VTTVRLICCENHLHGSKSWGLGRGWHWHSDLWWPMVVGENLAGCGQGMVKWVLVALLTGCHLMEVGGKSMGRGMVGVVGVEWRIGAAG